MPSYCHVSQSISSIIKTPINYKYHESLGSIIPPHLKLLTSSTIANLQFQGKMWQLWILPIVILLSSATHFASRVPEGHNGNSIRTSVFLSPPFFLRPGSVANKYHFNIPFPKGHIAVKSFDAEVVDENGVSIPLHETYLHHWLVERYYSEKKTQAELDLSKVLLAGNSGVCKGLGQDFGLGSETRSTSTWVPDPYGIEFGDPKAVPDGYEEGWMVNIHAIDTREVVDRSGCTECKCSLYNVTVDEHGRALTEDYIGGLRCCYDRTQCKLREGFNGGESRKLFLKYTVKWVEWDETILPVKIYIFDVTDTGKMSNASSGKRPRPSCKVEYQVNLCDKLDGKDNECVDTKKAKIVIPHGGDIVYGVAHQHSGGVGAALYGQDGRVLCTSLPTYGNGEEAGNESGYIVGMSTCYPKPGSVKVADGELLTLESNYSNKVVHTGVMGLFYILVAEPQPQSNSKMLFDNQLIPWGEKMNKYWWAFVIVGGIAAVAIMISFRQRYEEGYQSL